eukprot:3612322-Prymnesium_polylepis.2
MLPFAARTNFRNDFLCRRPVAPRLLATAMQARHQRECAGVAVLGTSLRQALRPSTHVLPMLNASCNFSTCITP